MFVHIQVYVYIYIHLIGSLINLSNGFSVFLLCPRNLLVGVLGVLHVHKHVNNVLEWTGLPFRELSPKPCTHSTSWGWTYGLSKALVINVMFFRFWGVHFFSQQKFFFPSACLTICHLENAPRDSRVSNHKITLRPVHKKFASTLTFGLFHNALDPHISPLCYLLHPWSRSTLALTAWYIYQRLYIDSVGSRCRTKQQLRQDTTEQIRVNLLLGEKPYPAPPWGRRTTWISNLPK